LPRKKTTRSLDSIPKSDYDSPTQSVRESLTLAIESARAGASVGAQQVIENLRSKFGEDLIPKTLNVHESPIPDDAIPFALTYAPGMSEAGLPFPSMDVDPTDDIILENFGTLRIWGREWIRNMALCAPLVDADFQEKGEDLQAHRLDISKIADPTLAVVCGSGSSLDEMTQLLPAFPGLIICGASNASACAAAGANPHAILAIDSGLGTVAHLMGVPFDERGSSLVCATSILPDVAKMFPHNRKWFTSIVQMQKGANHPFNVFSQLLFPYIQSFMFQAGCTVNAEILFLQLLVEMAALKLDAVYLLGVDFAYRKNRSRCSAFALRDNGLFEKRDAAASSDVPYVRSAFFRSANGLLTDETMLSYKRSLLTVWVITRLPLFDCSNGIITEVPKVDFKSLASQGFRGRPEPYSYERVIQTYNDYLTGVGYIPGKTAGAEGKPVSGELWLGSDD
jgi:hypothetical protein